MSLQWAILLGQSFALEDKTQIFCMSNVEQVLKQVAQNQSLELEDENHLAFWVHYIPMSSQNQEATS